MTTPLGNGLCVFKNITGGSLNSQGYGQRPQLIASFSK